MGSFLGHPMSGVLALAALSTREEPLTHEIGHYLGLWHPFQDAQRDANGDPISDCGNSNCQRSGDWICDTPTRFKCLVWL